MVESDKKEFNVVNGSIDEEKLKKYLPLFQKTNYQFGGRTKSYSDSYNFLNMVFKDQFPQIRLPYSAEGLLNYGKEIKKEEMKVGDIVFFANSFQQQYITHAALFIGDKKIAYISADGYTIAQLDSKPYSETIKQVRRIILEESED